MVTYNIGVYSAIYCSVRIYSAISLQCRHLQCNILYDVNAYCTVYRIVSNTVQYSSRLSTTHGHITDFNCEATTMDAMRLEREVLFNHGSFLCRGKKVYPDF